MGSQSIIAASHSSKVVVLEQSSGLALHPTEWNHVVLSEFSFNLSSWLILSGWNVCLILVIFFQVSVNWTCHFSVHLWQYSQLMTKLKQSCKSPVLGILYEERNYWVLPYTSRFLVWIGNFSYIKNCLKNDKISQTSTNLNQRTFPISRRRIKLPPKSILSLSGGFGPTTYRTQTAYWHSGWQKSKRHFQTGSCVWILVFA